MQLEPRTLGPTPSRHGENAPPQRPPGAAIQADLSGDQRGALREAGGNPGGAGATVPLQSQEEKQMLKNLQVFSLQDGVGHK